MVSRKSNLFTGNGIKCTHLRKDLKIKLGEFLNEKDNRSRPCNDAVFSLSACSGDSALNSFYKAIDSNDYSKAISIYNDKIVGNMEREIKAYDELVSKMNSAVNGYNIGQKVQIEATSLISTVERVGILEADMIDAARENLSNLANSKSAFSAAEDLYDKGLFISAYNSYVLVINEDINYNTAQAKMVEAMDAHVIDVIKQVDDFITDLDYENALELLDEAIFTFGVNEQLQTKKHFVEGQYTDYALEQAQQIFSNEKDYVSACDILKRAINNISDSTELSRLNNAYDNYFSYYPVRLLELDSYTSSEWNRRSSEWETTDKDNLGNTYTYGLKFYWNTSPTVDVTYLINGKYDKLSGKYLCHYDSRNVRSQADNIENFHLQFFCLWRWKTFISITNNGLES